MPIIKLVKINPITEVDALGRLNHKQSWLLILMLFQRGKEDMKFLKKIRCDLVVAGLVFVKCNGYDFWFQFVD